MRAYLSAHKVVGPPLPWLILASVNCARHLRSVLMILREAPLSMTRCYRTMLMEELGKMEVANAALRF